MKLLIDIGNTNIKYAFCEGVNLTNVICFAHAHSNFNETLTTLRDQLTKVIDRPQQIIISNVAGNKVAQEITQWAQQHYKLTPHFIIPTAQAHGVINAYAVPHTLGSDRWLALIAARQLTQSPVCIIDCGTATTVDVMDATGQHLGGLIAPGLNSLPNALATATAGCKLDIKLQHPPTDTPLGQSTQTCIENGSWAMIVHFVENVCRKTDQTFSSNTKIFISGGHANTIQSLLSITSDFQPHLVLNGMAVVSTQW